MHSVFLFPIFICFVTVRSTVWWMLGIWLCGRLRWSIICWKFVRSGDVIQICCSFERLIGNLVKYWMLPFFFLFSFVLWQFEIFFGGYLGCDWSVTNWELHCVFLLPIICFVATLSTVDGWLGCECVVDEMAYNPLGIWSNLVVKSVDLIKVSCSFQRFIIVLIKYRMLFFPYFSLFYGNFKYWLVDTWVVIA